MGDENNDINFGNKNIIQELLVAVAKLKEGLISSKEQLDYNRQDHKEMIEKLNELDRKLSMMWGKIIGISTGVAVITGILTHYFMKG